MGVEKPMMRASRSEGGRRNSTAAKHDDIRVTSQKQAMQHTVRAKKLDERQLFRFIKSLDDSKSRRLLQIDKEVAEVEKLLKRLHFEQEAARKEKEQRLSGSVGDDAPVGQDGDDAALVTRSANAVTGRRQRGAKKRKTTKMSKEFDEYAFRARQKRGSIGKLGREKEKEDKALNSYYRFDSGGNRRIVSPLISSPSKTPKPTALSAWDADFFQDDISVSNYTVATETESRIDSATNKSLSSLPDDAVGGSSSRAGTTTPGQGVFLTSGRSSSQANHRSKLLQNVTSKKSKSVKVKTPRGIDGDVPSPNPRTPKSQKAIGPSRVARPKSDTRSTASDSTDREDKSNVVKVTREDDDESPLGFVRSKLTIKRRPTPLEFELATDNQQQRVVGTTEYQEDELQRVSNVNACKAKSCQVADCIFHRLSSELPSPTTAHPEPLLLDEYYRVASASRSRATGKPTISPVFQSLDDRKWINARRVPVSPPSPTPSEILADIVIEHDEETDKPDYTDLEVMMSVRRPMKGSNRDLMLKDKEDNIKNTFKIMRQKMAASIPPDFNTNYGTPTPNWKILNPLKMRHKIAHKSPLFTLWKLN